MSGSKVILLIILVSGWFPVKQTRAQPLATDRAEEILSRNSDAYIPEEILEEKEELLEIPLNLNTASERELEATGLFTPFQAKVIIDYRRTYGDLLSIYELASLTGFRRLHLKEISRYLTVDLSIPPRIQSGPKSQAILYMGRAFPDATGYETGTDRPLPAYSGSPLKTSLKVKTGAGRKINMGLAFEKDPGEPGLWDHKPQHLTGYLQYTGNRWFEQFIIGNYRLHMAMGLTHGSGMFQTPGATGSIAPQLLKPYAGTAESGTHSGMACRLRFNQGKVMAWVSYQSLDLSLSHLETGGDHPDWASLGRWTGLHRTKWEIEGRSLGYLANAGMQALYNKKSLFMGIYFTTERSGLTQKVMDSNLIENKPSTAHTAGIHWRWQRGKALAFGEFAAGIHASCAFLSGLRYDFNGFLSIAAHYHQYGPAHRETFSAAYSSGSHTSNEKGFALAIHAEPYRTLLAELSAECFGYPSPRYQVHVPSGGFRYRFTLQGTARERTNWRIMLIKKEWQQTPSIDQPGIRSMLHHNLTRFDIRLAYHINSLLIWQTRLIASFIHDHETGFGYTALQQIKIKPGTRYNCTLQCVVFHVDRWENRIYVYEPGLYHQFNFPVYYGQGQKASLVISIKPFNRFTVEGKGSVIRYYDRNEIGSGNDLLNGSRKYQAGIQLRYSF